MTSLLSQLSLQLSSVLRSYVDARIGDVLTPQLEGSSTRRDHSTSITVNGEPVMLSGTNRLARQGEQPAGSGSPTSIALEMPASPVLASPPSPRLSRKAGTRVMPLEPLSPIRHVTPLKPLSPIRHVTPFPPLGPIRHEQDPISAVPPSRQPPSQELLNEG